MTTQLVVVATRSAKGEDWGSRRLSASGPDYRHGVLFEGLKDQGCAVMPCSFFPNERASS